MQRYIEAVKAWKKRRDEQPKEYSFGFGDFDPMDAISYEGMEEQAEHLVVDGQYMRTLFIAALPHTAEIGWLDDIINFQRNADVSFHIEPVDSTVTLPMLTRKITERETVRRMKERKGEIIGSDILDPLESASALRDAIQRGQEKFFQVAIYATLVADSQEELDETTKTLEAALSARLFRTRSARFRQPDAMRSVLPRGENKLNQKLDLNSSSAALALPFISSEFVQEQGILYGVNNSNNSLVILDRFSLHNANSIVFAQSGSGKSYAMKVEILRQLMQGTKVIVIDPEREYANLCSSVGGTYIKLSANSKQKINPFDFSTTSHNKEQLAEHAQDLIEIISLMAGSTESNEKSIGLDPQEQAAVDKAILATYNNAKGKTPVLSNFYEELRKIGQLKLCERLDRYLTGTLEGVFNKPTNVKLDNRLVVFDIQEMPGSLRQIMMMIIANFVQNQVKAKPEKRILVIDEAWLLLEHQQSARFVAGLVRRARKYYLGVAIISQQANDFLDNTYGRTIASQSALRILMKQDTTTIQKVADEFRLSDYEKDYLLTCDKGMGLILADQSHVAVRVVASPEEHPLITTDPAER
jgi:type IV secretory pathway VirB4 component